MIYSLNGKLIFKDATTAVIECVGVGYKCSVSSKSLALLPDEGEQAFLFTYMQVREDSVDLYGFNNKTELEMFKLLISINGVGAKAALSILSFYSPEQVMLFIASQDSKSLTAAAGIGAKIASRIVLELKDKVGTEYIYNENISTTIPTNNSVLQSQDAIEALISFGFSASEARSAVGKCDNDLPVDELIKQALKFLSK